MNYITSYVTLGVAFGVENQKLCKWRVVHPLLGDKLTPFVLRHGEIVYILICTSLLRLVTISCRHKCPMNFDPRPHSPPTTSGCIEPGNNSLTKMLNQLDVSLQPIFYFLFSLFQEKHDHYGLLDGCDFDFVSFFSNNNIS